jgi:enamine deaminase RidA (YjgF/YER057c/UK114 family)
MVLDMPMFTHRIEILESEVVSDVNDPSVGHLRIKSFRVVSKREGAVDGNEASNIWLDEASNTTLSSSRSGPWVVPPKRSIAQAAVAPLAAPPSVDGLGCSHLLMPDAAVIVATEDCIEKQVENLMVQLSEILERYGGVLADVCFVHLYVSDMSNFGSVNSAYSKYFGRNPPSRSCISVSNIYLRFYMVNHKSADIFTLFDVVQYVQAVLPSGVQVALQATYLIGSYASMGLGRSARREVPCLSTHIHITIFIFIFVQHITFFRLPRM